MNPEMVEKVALVLASATVGWLASMLTTYINERRASRKERRRVAARLWLALGTILKELAALPALHEAGALTVAGVLGEDESWRHLVPPGPPSLPEEFDDVLAKVAEWEASTGDAVVTEKLQLLRSQLKILHSLHAGLSKQAQMGAESISKQAAQYYTKALAMFGDDLQVVLRLVDPLRFTLFQRARKKLSAQAGRLRDKLMQKRRRKLLPSEQPAA